MKKVSRIFLAAVCALTISAGAAYASAVPNEKYVDISFTQLAREYSYSRGLVTLNITEGSKSNESHVSSGIQNPNAKVTRVELNGMIRTANMKGTGNASWWVRHEGSQTMTPSLAIKRLCPQTLLLVSLLRAIGRSGLRGHPTPPSRVAVFVSTIQITEK